MVHLVGGNLIVPTGRQGARATNLNIKVNEKTYIGAGAGLYGNFGNCGSFGMPGMYGMQGMYDMPGMYNYGMYGMPGMGNYGMPGMYSGGCCQGNNSMNFGDYMLGGLSAASGFLQKFLGGKENVKPKATNEETNNQAFNTALQQGKEQLAELNKKQQATAQAISELKAASEAYVANIELKEDNA